MLTLFINCYLFFHCDEWLSPIYICISCLYINTLLNSTIKIFTRRYQNLFIKMPKMCIISLCSKYALCAFLFLFRIDNTFNIKLMQNSLWKNWEGRGWKLDTKIIPIIKPLSLWYHLVCFFWFPCLWNFRWPVLPIVALNLEHCT